ncbi:hypothetical protein KZ843_09690 [Pseudomonas aeruginosa]|nr:hypothetical protein [Pseudomonas aeruginosa]MBW6123156.1 hypothetical protein [Pseudomonas aeruginosa]
MFQRIDHLITKEGFALQAWDDRYSKGVWAALGTNQYEVDVVRDLSDAGDLDMDPAMDYVFSADWLPYVTGKNLADALIKLEARLAELPSEELNRASLWARLVSEAIDDLREGDRQAEGYGDLEGKLSPLPKTYSEAVAQSATNAQEN